MKTILLSLFVLLLFQGVVEVNAQSNVYHRSEATSSLWWESNAPLPWWRTPENAAITRPDVNPYPNKVRTFVNIGHNVNAATPMVVNGDWFDLKSLRLQAGANANRTFNEYGVAGISIDTGIFNESPGTHTFNVRIGVDGASVVFDAIHGSGSMVFNRTIFLNNNTARFVGPGSISVSGDITGTGGIVKEGTGALTLTGANTFAGLTTVRAGVLELNRPGGNTLNAVNSVVVEGGTLRIRTPQTLSSLTVHRTGSVVVEPGGSLNITGTIINNAGNTGIVIRDGGSLIHNTANVPATMQRFFSGSAQWRLVSSPVANQAISGPWTPASPSHGYDFYAWYENRAIWRNQKDATNHITHFEPGKGYLVSFEGTNLTQSFAGPLNNGDVTVPVARANTGIYAGANLLGNPYASSIDWHLADRSLFADHFAYIYDPLLGGGGGYVTVNGANPGALIAPNQGFFVIRATSAPANFTFTNAMRAHGGVFKSAPAAQRISLTLSHGGWFDQAVITLQPDATALREPSDALKFFSYNVDMMPQIYTTSSDGMRLAINSIGQITQESSFNIGIRANATGQFILQIEGLEGELMGLPAFLRDLATGQLHNLRENSRVSFNATKGEPMDRFILTFVQPTNVDNLPVDAALVYFSNGMLHMQFPAEERNRQLQVIDLSGRVVLSKSLHGLGNIVSVPLQIDNGAYIVRITGETSITSRRIWVK